MKMSELIAKYVDEIKWRGGTYSGFNHEIMASQAHDRIKHEARLKELADEIDRRLP